MPDHHHHQSPSEQQLSLSLSFRSAGLQCISCGYGEAVEESEAVKKAVKEVIVCVFVKLLLVVLKLISQRNTSVYSSGKYMIR